MIITRSLQALIEKRLFQKKVIILYGARQVGKTTLAKAILDKYDSVSGYLNCDIIRVATAFEQLEPAYLRSTIGETKIVVLDEAQRVRNIGLALKLLVDTYPNIQIIATGSSSFDLANTISEPLTGRSLEFILYPFSYFELTQSYTPGELSGQIERTLRFGLYPEIVTKSDADARVFLDELAGKYLYKDVLSFAGLRRSDLVVKLLQLLAFQVGNEVSIHELATRLVCSRDTVIHYLDILEKAFVIFPLRSLSRNLRNELTKKHKYYFYDVGIRNSIISQYNLVSQRNDVGSLWENYCLVERKKYLQRMEISGNQYFWRTHDQQEIDYVEEREGKLFGYEFKWGDKRLRKPRAFLEAYPNSDIELVNQKNYPGFIGLP